MKLFFLIPLNFILQKIKFIVVSKWTPIRLQSFKKLNISSIRILIIPKVCATMNVQGCLNTWLLFVTLTSYIISNKYFKQMPKIMVVAPRRDVNLFTRSVFGSSFIELDSAKF